MYKICICIKYKPICIKLHVYIFQDIAVQYISMQLYAYCKLVSYMYVGICICGENIPIY